MAQTSPEMRLATGTPDRMIALDSSLSTEAARFLATDALWMARQTMPRVTGQTSRRLSEASGEGWFGIYFPDAQAWFMEQGTKPRSMRSLSGKSQPMSELVLTPIGWRKMGSMEIGDLVISSTGAPAPVMGIYPQGDLECYRVTFSDGTSTRCSGDHLWTARRSRSGNSRWETRSTSYLAERLNAGWRIPLVGAVQFDGPRDLPVDPYLLGVLLGDGHLSGSSPTFSAGGTAVPDQVRDVLPEGLILRKTPSSNYSWTITAGQRGQRENPLSTALRRVGVKGLHSWEKFIPAVYLAGTVDQRIALLQGVLDSDGSCTQGHVRFHSCSVALAEDVSSLVRGLGGTACMHSEVVGRGLRRPMHTVQVTMPEGVAPFRADQDRLTSFYTHTKRRSASGKTIVSIEREGVEEMQCISIDTPDHLYVTEGYTLTHNTIPMWVNDADGSLRKDPKAKTRVTEDGRTQVLIFRKAARPGQRKITRRRSRVSGQMETTSVPMSYPGAPGRIGSRSPGAPNTPAGEVGGQIRGGNVGVRWRHPGIKAMQFLNSAITIAAFDAGIALDRVYVVDGPSFSMLLDRRR